MDRGFFNSGAAMRRGWQGGAAMLAAALCLLALPVQAKERATIQASADAVVVSQLSFFKVDDLVFGRIIPGTTAGTVIVAPTGARSATGGARLASGIAPQAASFAGKGRFNQAVTIALGSATSSLNRVGGGGSMTLDTFVIGSTPTALLTTAPLAFRIGTSTGIFQFPVGATLRVKARQAPGTYVGNFSITLQYQ